MANKISSYIEDVRTEVKKVNWLSKDELMGSTVIVVVFSIIMASFLFVADYSISELISWFLRS
jgi:preprotein translocase subunit SecE